MEKMVSTSRVRKIQAHSIFVNFVNDFSLFCRIFVVWSTVQVICIA